MTEILLLFVVVLLSYIGGKLAAILDEIRKRTGSAAGGQ